jgi:hypothetical protein
LKYSHDFGGDEKWSIISADEPDPGCDAANLKTQGPVGIDHEIAFRWLGGTKPRFMSYDPMPGISWILPEHVKKNEIWTLVAPIPKASITE